MGGLGLSFDEGLVAEIGSANVQFAEKRISMLQNKYADLLINPVKL